MNSRTSHEHVAPRRALTHACTQQAECALVLRADSLARELDLLRAGLARSSHLRRAAVDAGHAARAAERQVSQVRTHSSHNLAHRRRLHARGLHRLLIHLLRLVVAAAVLRRHADRTALRRLHHRRLLVQEARLALRPVAIVVERVVAQADTAALLQEAAVLADQHPLEIGRVHHCRCHVLQRAGNK